MKRKTDLKRSVLLFFFGGEEWGLWGSRYFVNQPLVPLTQVKAMFSLDTLGGKTEEKELFLIGGSIHSSLAQASRRFLEPLGIKEGKDIDQYSFGFGSDHYPFHQKGIQHWTFSHWIIKKWLLWKSLVSPFWHRGRHKPGVPAAADPRNTDPVRDNANPLFPPAFFEMAASGRPHLLIFSGADRLYWEFQEKFVARYGERLKSVESRYNVHVIANANHVLSLPEWRMEMMKIVEEWLGRNFAR